MVLARVREVGADAGGRGRRAAPDPMAGRAAEAREDLAPPQGVT
jgi:hypothetical protein